MYRKRDRQTNQSQVHMVCIDELVPKDHILRDIDAAIDFSFIYDEVEGMYSDFIGGRPAIDPVSLFKIVMIQYIFGIRSMRQTIKEIECNVAYRWFIGYDLNEEIPHFSTFGKNYSRRFKDTDIFERIFEHILEEAIASGFVDEKVIFIDGTHIKANANKKKAEKVLVEKKARRYRKDLEHEINLDRKKHDKKPLKDKDSRGDDEGGTSEKEVQVEKKKITQSTTDPESGLFCKGEHERQFAYTANTACDRHNYILAVELNPGNVHDSVAFDDIYGQLKERYEKLEAVVMDAGYKTPWIMKQIIDDGRVPVTPYKRPMTPKGYLKKYEYVYDEYYDCVICPNNEILKYTTTNREGYREYKSDQKVCKSCPYLEKCTQSKAHQKVVELHIWEKYMEQAEEYRHMRLYKKIYEKRKETIERVFADAKEKHGMRYTQYRGLEKVKMETVLRFACMNLKKLAKMKRRRGLLQPSYLIVSAIIEKLTKVYWSLFAPIHLLSTV